MIAQVAGSPVAGFCHPSLSWGAEDSFLRGRVPYDPHSDGQVQPHPGSGLEEADRGILPKVAGSGAHSPGRAVGRLDTGAPHDSVLSRGADCSEGVQLPVGTEAVSVLSNIVTDGYFGTVGVPLLEGREFQTTDGPDAQRVAVVFMPTTTFASLARRKSGVRYTCLWRYHMSHSTPVRACS